ncbi:hypothetical protein GGI04_005700 [Coemansia thaxteri]|uniref:Uncharacterized protein n=1 Tax=Coemansia thaxteri TaxID=2663907 RepID=A0A9W8BAH3_9FUNG|nr:hypothetical protein GGI04_005700 [Coemansia thaxteri]KAJ2000237.1 hypothetical protein H4R26_004711 [Coemansia thaxteri]KAJ2466339.1 hypothetical protein GGI02_004404 [Coemansia sp. RSA 2322]KAJ2484052.1 hypothetical protein EV174_002751 [Coemansia sp. RSA 2320]
MLSNGISSRLQRLQGAQEGTCRDGLQQHGHVPARNGLAADLIRKFNQLSSGDCSLAAASIGQSGAGLACHTQSKEARQAVQRDLFGSRGGGGDSANRSCASIASDGSTAVDCEQAEDDERRAAAENPRIEALADAGAPQTSASPFLSDSELDRALFEIQKLSREMDISLADDELL